MKFINHGNWIPYKPAKEDWPDGAPPNAMFCKRESDGKDWYKHVNDPKSFRPDSVKFMAAFQEFWKGFVIGPAVTDPTLLFPQNQVVREIIDYPDPTDEDSLIARFRNKMVNLDTNEISDQPKLPEAPDLYKLTEEIGERLAKLDERLLKIEKRVK